MTLQLQTRKLLPLQEDHNPTMLSSPPPHHPHHHSPPKPKTTTNNNNYCNNIKLNPPFDSAMALTVLVLLTALFFMGFFSIYIRRFADESNVDPNRRRRGSNNSSADTDTGTNMGTTSYLSRVRETVKGADPKVVKALPVYAYCRGDAKQGMMKYVDEMECAICLSEFEEEELIKEIPYCGHVFHVECIDTWLDSHVTCPLCRTAKLLVEEVVVEDGGGEGLGEVEGEMRLVVDGGDTWSEEVGPRRMRLHRSMSF